MYFRALASACIAVSLVLALAHCDDDSSAPALISDASIAPAVDAANQDAFTPPGPDAATDAATKDASIPDSAVDAAPIYDDAGCSIPTIDPLPSAAAAGIPANGLVLWLRADDGVSTTASGEVCRWKDLSGNGYDFEPPNDRPTFGPTAVRGRPAVNFVGDNTALRRSDVLGIAATSARTVAAFGATADTTHRFNYFYQGNYATNDKYWGLDQNAFNTAGSKEGVYCTGNAYDSNVATSTAARSHVYAIDTFTPGPAILSSIHYDIDGVATTLTRTPAGTGNGNIEDFSGATRTEIGSGRSGFTGGVLGELIVYDRALDATERAALNTYFQTRFAP